MKVSYFELHEPCKCSKCTEYVSCLLTVSPTVNAMFKGIEVPVAARFKPKCSKFKQFDKEQRQTENKEALRRIESCLYRSCYLNQVRSVDNFETLNPGHPHMCDLAMS